MRPVSRDRRRTRVRQRSLTLQVSGTNRRDQRTIQLRFGRTMTKEKAVFSKTGSNTTKPIRTAKRLGWLAISIAMVTLAAMSSRSVTSRARAREKTDTSVTTPSITSTSEHHGESPIRKSVDPLDRLEVSGGLYRLLVETVRDYAIFALDKTGHIVTWNAGAQRFKGYTADEIIGKHFSVFYPPEDIARRKPDRELVEAEQNGRLEDEGWRVRNDGSRFWANVVITALRDKSGELVGFAKVTRDLTERKAAEARALTDARLIVQAEAASLAKSEFLAAMSHELRTPLNAIGGYVDLLQLGIRGPLTDEQQEYLDRIRRSQKHLLAIISDLLNFSRIEAGQITYDIRPVVMQEVFDAVGPMIVPQAMAKSVDFQWEKLANDVVVSADRSRLEQILLNLLSNAVKFTDEGGRVRMTSSSTDGHVRVDVADTGIGIPKENLSAIFEPFVQVGRSLTSNTEGTGLGLAISRDLARAMKAELSVESTPGKGSTFTLLLRGA
jgi:PAS domain S-box-containing protein